MQLDRIYGTDRVSDLNIPQGIDVVTIPGAKLEALVQNALEYGQPHTAYFICGIPDLTHAPVDKPGYREVTVPRMSIAELTDVYISLVRSVSAQLWQYDIRPVFAPPVAMDIEHFNKFLLDEGVTHDQYHNRNYSAMQDMLNKVVSNLLIQIKQINQENQVYTPCLESIVMKYDLKDPSLVRFHFDQLVDGLHLSQEAKATWSMILRRSLIVNRRILLGASPTAAVSHINFSGQSNRALLCPLDSSMYQVLVWRPIIKCSRARWLAYYSSICIILPWLPENLCP